MFAIGNNELSDVSIKQGDMIRNRMTKETAVIQFGKDADTGIATNVLCFVTLEDKKSYMVGITGKLLTDEWELINE